MGWWGGEKVENPQGRRGRWLGAMVALAAGLVLPAVAPEAGAAGAAGVRAIAPSASPPVLEGYRQLFQVLDKGEELDGALDRSTWPRDDHLASYLELELLFHPGYSQTFSRLREFYDRWPDHAHIEKVARILDLRMAELGGDVETLAWFDRRPPRSNVGRIRYLDLLVKGDRWEEARELFREHYLGGGQITGHHREALLARFPDLLDAKDDQVRARALLDKGYHQLLTQFLPVLPKEHQELYQAILAAREGSARFADLVAALPPEMRKDPELWRSRVEYLMKRGQRLAALDLLNGQEGQWLEEGDRWLFRYRLGREFLYIDEDHGSAFAVLDRNGKEAGGKLEDSLWLAGWSAYLNGDRKSAMERFMRLGREGIKPHMRSQGAYWAAHELRRQGSDPTVWLEEAARHPDSFYGLLASEEVKQPLPPDDGVIRNCPQELDRLAADPAIKAVMQGMRNLQELDRSHHNGAEVSRLARVHGLSLPVQLCLAITFDSPNSAVAMASRLRDEGVISWQGLFPVPGWRPAVGWDLDPAIIWGLVRQESLFQPGVKSHAGAVGLMQLMPATARMEAKKGGYAHPSPYRMRLPGYNLTLGQQHLQRLLRIYDGDMVLSLVAYNAGPGRANRWKEDRMRYSPVSFIERIPISETRQYVPKVMLGMAAYRLSYGQSSALGEMLKVGGTRPEMFQNHK